MKIRNKNERHTKEWTFIRLFALIGLLCFELFSIFWLIFYEQQLIASFVFMAFALMSIIGILRYCINIRKKNYLKLLENDIKEDAKLREKYGMAYDIWKANTLPNIVKK